MTTTMTLLRRVAPLLVGALFLFVTSNARWGHATALVDPVGLAVVLFLPWITLASTDSVHAAGATFSDAFLKRPSGTPSTRLVSTRSRLRFVAGASIAAGVIVACMGLVEEINAIAGAKGNVDAGVWPRFAASMLLGPLYGIALKTFLYDPAESALAAADGELVDLFE